MNPNANTPPNPLHEAFLTSRLDALKGGLLAVEAPARIEGELLNAFRRKRTRAARPTFWWMPPLALAATAAIVSWMVRGPIDMQPATPAATVALSDAEADPGPFLALRPLERIALEPGATVVATEFPRALLADWGLPVSPERAGEPVRAEMLYSAKGEPLAVRLIN